MITKIEIPCSPDPVSGKSRKLVHKRIEIGQGLEMIQHFAVEFWEVDELGEYTEKTLAFIQNSPTFTDIRKQRLSQTYADRDYIAKTEGNTVNLFTGDNINGIEPDENGNYPEGIQPVSELEYWQLIPLSAFPPEITTASGIVYSLISQALEKVISSENI